MQINLLYYWIQNIEVWSSENSEQNRLIVLHHPKLVNFLWIQQFFDGRHQNELQDQENSLPDSYHLNLEVYVR